MQDCGGSFVLLRAPAGDAQVSREDLLSVLGCGPESWCKAAGASVTQEGFSSWIETLMCGSWSCRI